MATTRNDWTGPRARVAALSRSRTDDDLDLLAARQDLKAARLANHVRDAVDSAPPLTDEQRERIAALLRPTAGAA